MARTAIHPGEHLKLELEELGLSASELARQLRVPANRLTEIIAGERSITAETAILLGHWFGMSAAFWLNLQTMYDLRNAEKTLGKSIAKLPTLKRATAQPTR
jgi:antitoxin HigA-1